MVRFSTLNKIAFEKKLHKHNENIKNYSYLRKYYFIPNGGESLFFFYSMVMRAEIHDMSLLHNND